MLDRITLEAIVQAEITYGPPIGGRSVQPTSLKTALLVMAWHQGRVMSCRGLAARMCVADTQGAHRAVLTLERMGLIDRERVSNRGSVFRVNRAALRSMATREPLERVRREAVLVQ
jgi:hypothetical protein